MEVLTLASHTGSHVDSPLHKIAGGVSITEMPLESFMGPARIADLRPLEPNQPIGPDLLEKTLSDIQPGEIALLCTGWGDIRERTETWLRDSPFLTPEGARWIVTRDVRAVGIDHYSIAGSREPNNADTHTILLDSGVWIVEELKFPPEAFAAPRPSLFLSLPINLRGHSGAFCRPVLMLD
jgi:kynurenine formamidase